MSIQTTAFRSAYDLAFQVSPIILVGGIASGSIGNMLPIIALTGQAAAFAQGALSGGLSMEDFYARFVPLPGSTVINNTAGKYPFANQQVAANAIIEEPNSVSLRMIAPVKSGGGYLSKMAIFTALQTSLRTHNNAGGTYHIATPSYIYTNCLLLQMSDITSDANRQQQIEWQLDFERPLITQEAAASAQASLNAKMSKLVGGNKLTDSKWSSPNTAQGSTAQGAAQNISRLAGGVNQFLANPL